MKNESEDAIVVQRALIACILVAASLCVNVSRAATTLIRTSSFTYDATTGLLASETIEPDTPDLTVVTTYIYDAYGNKASVTVQANGSLSTGDIAYIDPRTSSNIYAAGSITIGGTYYTYTVGQFPTTGTNALSQSEAKTYDPRFGGVASLTGPNGLTTSWSYDGFGRKSQETRADGTTTTWTYTLCGTCPTYGAYYVTQTTTGAPTVATYYDKLNREIRTQTQGFDGTLIYRDTQYDTLGRVSQVSLPYYAGGTPQWMVSSYDTLGRVKVQTFPTTSAGTRAIVVDYNALTTTTTIGGSDGHGGVTGTGMPNGQVQAKTTTKNSQGQTAIVADTQNNLTIYTYDPFDNLLTTTAGGVVTTLGYDLRGRKTSMSDPDMGSWTYVYNIVGELKQQTDAKNQVTNMTYDALGRMTNRAEADLVSNWYYDAYKNGTTCAKGIGKLCEADSPLGGGGNGYNRQYTYDTLGRISQIATVIDASYTIGYAYDSSGRLSQTTYPTGFATKNNYNSYGYLYQVQKSDGSVTYWQANTMSATGRVTADTLGNGLTSSRSYDQLDHPMALAVNDGGTAMQSFTYQYDVVGNMAQRVDVVEGNLTETFSYDNLNRLLQSGGSGLTTRTYGYDALGNITSKSDVGTYTYPTTGQPLRHAVSSITGTVEGLTNPYYDYDANGNLRQVRSATGTPCATAPAVGERCLIYESFNLPVSITASNFEQPGTNATYNYLYNVDHERVKLVKTTTLDTDTTIYLHPAGKGRLLYEKETWTGSGLVENRNYITAGAMLIGVYIGRSDSTTETRYFHEDHLGSLALTTDESGTLVERFAYEAFGKRRFPNGADDPNNTIFGMSTDRGFTGHEHLDEMALIHMNGRIYDPVLARFMTPDPAVPGADNLQAYNRYSYVFNNPLMYADASGYWPGFLEELGITPKTVVAITVAYFTGYYDFAGAESAVHSYGIFSATQMGLNGGLAAFGNAVVSGAALGGINSGSWDGALQGGLSAGMFWGVGSFVPGNTGDPLKVLAHAAVGCVSAGMGGENCGRGALSAGFSEFAGPKLDDWGEIGNAVKSAILGGTASVIDGGKFSNGAATAAYGYLFNQAAHQNTVVYSGRPLTPGEVDAALAEFPTLKIDSIRVAYDMSGDAAYTPNDTMHFPTSMSSCQDFSSCSNGAYVGWFEHEATHVWQYQTGTSPFWGHIFSSSIFQFGNYLPLSTYVTTPSSQGLNTEQQADWHKWHYLCTHGLQQGC